tara:strand:- start:606 stop:935 length:330 start_codon:yes stop_codon:yes gene_type:complete
MKTFLFVISLLFSVSLYSQKVTLLYVNSSWNKSNDYKHLSTLKNVRVLKVNYDDQPKKFREQVKSVPAIILFDENNKLKRVWQGGLSMSLNVDPKDIQAMVNKIINEKK